MIQRATDPNAKPWRPAAGEDRAHPAAQAIRPAHAWPFISRTPARTGATPPLQRQPETGFAS